MFHWSGVDERVHTYSLTYGQSIMICFYMIGLWANFTMREVVSSANSFTNCHYDFRTHSVRHTVSIDNRFPWLYIVFSLPDSCVSSYNLVFSFDGCQKGEGACFYRKGGYQEGGMKKERVRLIHPFALCFYSLQWAAVLRLT